MERGAIVGRRRWPRDKKKDSSDGPNTRARHVAVGRCLHRAAEKPRLWLRERECAINKAWKVDDFSEREETDKNYILVRSLPKITRSL